jgi:hypothetical protein
MAKHLECHTTIKKYSTMEKSEAMDETMSILAKTKTSSFGHFGICALVLIEPVFFFYQMTNWAFDPLNDQYLIAMFERDISDTLRANHMSNVSERTDYLHDVNGVWNDSRSRTVFAGSHSVYSQNTTDNVTTGWYANGTARSKVILTARRLRLAYDIDSDKSGMYSILDDFVEEKTTQWIMMLAVVRDVLAMFVTLFLCTHTDIMGRKIAVILPLIGYLLRISLYAIMIGSDLSVQYLLLGAVLEGLSGGELTMAGACFAYLADVVPVESRSIR